MLVDVVVLVVDALVVVAAPLLADVALVVVGLTISLLVDTAIVPCDI